MFSSSLLKFDSLIRASSKTMSESITARSSCLLDSEASVTVGSICIRMSPFLTLSDSLTNIFETTPLSRGFSIFISPLGMTLPCALTTTSTLASISQAVANTIMASTR